MGPEKGTTGTGYLPGEKLHAQGASPIPSVDRDNWIVAQHVSLARNNGELF